MVSKEVLSQRTADYQAWVEAFARNHRLPIESAHGTARAKFAVDSLLEEAGFEPSVPHGGRHFSSPPEPGDEKPAR